MRDYLTPLGAAHAALGGLGAAVGLLCVAIPGLLALYAVYDAYYTFAYLLEPTEPIHLWYPIERMLHTLFLTAVLSVPGWLMLAGGGVGLFAGVGLWKRWRLGRLAAFVAAVPSLLLGLPGIALGIGTCVVLLDADVRREFQPTGA